MAFNAGAITGAISLDTRPLTESVSRATRIMGGLKSATSSIFQGIGMAIGTQIAGAVASIPGRMSAVADSIDSTGKAARSLGITTEALTSLNYAAQLSGMSSEGLAMSIKMMQRNLAEAVSGAGPAKDSLRDLGLSAAVLASASPEDALGMIADSLKTIENPAQRTAVMMDLFGRQAGPELAALLAEGSAGLQAAAQRAKELGVTFSDVDAAKVEQANDAMTKVGMVVQGVLQQAVIEVAPYITAIADLFTDAAASGGGFGKTVLGAIEWVTKAVATLADWLELPRAGFYGLQAAATAQIMLVVKAIDLAGQALVGLMNLLPGVEVEWTNTFTLLADELGSEVSKSMDKAQQSFERFATGANSAAVAEFFDQAKAKADEAAQAVAAAGAKGGAAFVQGLDPNKLKPIQDELAKVQQEIAQFGMTDLEKRVDVFAQISGVTPEQVEQFKQQIESLRGLQAGAALGNLRFELEDIGLSDVEKKMADLRRQGIFNDDELKEARGLLEEIDAQTKVKAALDSIKSPLDELDAKMAEFNQWLAEGRIDQQQFNQLSDKARQDAFGETKLAPLLKAGSAADLALQYDQGRGAMETKDVPKQQLAEQKKTNEQLGNLGDLMRRLIAGDGPSAPIIV